MQTKFNRGITLQEAIDELRYNGCTEITRIMHDPNSAFIFEYEVEEFQ